MTKKTEEDVEALICPATAAGMLGIKVQTLAAWRNGRGPVIPFLKIGRHKVMYHRSDVLAFMRSRRVQNTAEGCAL